MVKIIQYITVFPRYMVSFPRFETVLCNQSSRGSCLLAVLGTVLVLSTSTEYVQVRTDCTSTAVPVWAKTLLFERPLPEIITGNRHLTGTFVHLYRIYWLIL